MGESLVLVWYGLGLILVSIFIVLLAIIVLERRKRRSIDEIKRDLETLKQSVGALCSSAVGVDKRVSNLERHSRDLEVRQESFEQSSQSEPPYSEAIRMVRNGATRKQLVEELDISQGAADLIFIIHGMKDEVRH